MGSMREGWRQCWRESALGLWACERLDGSRVRCDVRGAVAWPVVRRVGVQHAASGALLVLGFVPAENAVRVLGWAAFASLAPVLDPQGWPADLGAAGAFREALGFWGFERVYGLHDEAEMAEWARGLRGMIAPEGDRLRFRGWGLPGEDADGIVWRWAAARRLRLEGALSAAMDAERGRWVGEGPLSVRDALAAGLWSYERRAWRAPDNREPWRAIDAREVGR